MPCTRTLAAPIDGDVACTRNPPISLSIITMSPGVMSIFSSISSRPSTSTRVGWSSSRRPVRVVATTITSSSTVGSGVRVTASAASRPATIVRSAVTSANPSLDTVSWSRPGAAGTCATPLASVTAVAAPATTAAPSRGPSSLRTSMRTTACGVWGVWGP